MDAALGIQTKGKGQPSKRASALRLHHPLAPLCKRPPCLPSMSMLFCDTFCPSVRRVSGSILRRDRMGCANVGKRRLVRQYVVYSTLQVLLRHWRPEPLPSPFSSLTCSPHCVEELHVPLGTSNTPLSLSIARNMRHGT